MPSRTMDVVAFGPGRATPETLLIFGGAIVVVATLSIAVLRWRATPGGKAFVLTH